MTSSTWRTYPRTAIRELELRRLYVDLQVEVEMSAEAKLEEAQLEALEQRQASAS